jgi:hypothetical protein
MNSSWRGFWNHREASTVNHIISLAAIGYSGYGVYHTLSEEETAHTISEKIQAVITGEPTDDGERLKQEEQTQISPEAVDSEEQTLPQRNENPAPPLPEEEEESLGMPIAKGAGEAALDFVGFYDAKAALTGVDEEGNSIGVGERFLRGAMVIPIAKPVKGAKMAVKYGDKALTAGKKKLDDVAQRGKKTACGCPSTSGTKTILKQAQLQTKGKIRFVPPDKWTPSQQLPKKHGGYVDKFGNVWTKGPSRTKGQPFERDVQLSKTGKNQLGHLSRDGSHLNVSLDGKITHK